MTEQNKWITPTHITENLNKEAHKESEKQNRKTE